MDYPTPLIPARLLRRYKRFLADVILPDGSEAIVHCPNPGSMLGLADAGTVCWLSDHRGGSRKLPFGWELAELVAPLQTTPAQAPQAQAPQAQAAPAKIAPLPAAPGETGGRHLVGINTGHANIIVAEALAAGRIAALAGYDEIRREVKVGSRSRLDFQLLRQPGGQSGPAPSCFVEVKSVTLSRHRGLAEFPDAPTTRGARHLTDLADLAAQGHRAVLLFLVQRDDCSRVSCAADIDPAYASTLRQVAGQVDIHAYGCAFTWTDGRPAALSLAGEIPVELP
ncbi:MAG TPA: DNA/RNA nuclease SfsA [Dongiaceae bacterium]|nr:DNA/RNA nuclease SfsA [Dongiaceae bacterium]